MKYKALIMEIAGTVGAMCAHDLGDDHTKLLADANHLEAQAKQLIGALAQHIILSSHGHS